MESFHWDDTYKTGIHDVDDQHHKLVNIINQLGTLLTKNILVIADMDVIFKQLTDYTVYHFQEEEKLIEETKVDLRHLDHHIQSHKNFVDDVTALYSGLSKEGISKARDFLKYLIYWLAYHILGEDQDMAHQIDAIQSGMTSLEAYQRWEQGRDPSTAPLLDALSGLFEQVAIRNKELKQLNDTLEQKVEERTKALSKANRDLEKLSLTDPLTELHNRRFAMQQLAEIWQESIDKDLPLTCLMIDADRFKEINDVFGHDNGDRALLGLANAFRFSLRKDDYICRLGGDEFLVICPVTDIKGGMHIAEITRKAVSEIRIPVRDKAIQCSVSIGVAARNPEMKCYEDLIKASDNGVYAAKASGKNCVRKGEFKST